MSRIVIDMPSKQPVYKRQQFLLAFVKQLKDKTTATDLQKIVFLYSKNKDASYYDFMPYKYGAYSFQLAQDVEVLCKIGYMTSDNRLVAPELYSPTITIDGASIESLRGNPLIRKTYELFPYYAIKSEIADKVLYDTALQTVRAVKQQTIKDTRILFSIGYEGKSIENFVNTLIENDVRLLCDVRRNPISRKFGFSQGKLQHIVESIGIIYIHIPALGIESEERQSLETQEDFAKLFLGYKKSLPSRELALRQVYLLLRSNTRIAIMCYEQDPNFCHRNIIKNYLAETYHIRGEDL